MLQEHTCSLMRCACHACAGMYQRQVANVRLLGEAYSYRLVDSGVVFDTLHLLIAFGHDNSETAATLDPPTSFFRIRCGAFESSIYHHPAR